MSNLEELIEKLCPDGVEYKTLGDVATISRGGNFQKKDFTEQGNPCIHYGQIYTRYGLFTDKTLTFINDECFAKQKYAEPNDIIMAVTSENIEDICKCVAWLGTEKVAVSGHSAIIHHSLDPKYLTYFFHSQHFFNQKRKLAHGTKVMEVTPDTLKSIQLPVPPLEVQREIVRILDNFTFLSAELAAELAARQKQYEYYKEYLFENHISDVEWKRLDELFPFIRNGFVGTIKSFFTNEIDGIRYLEGTNIHDGVISDNEILYVTKEFHEKHIKNQLKADDILMVQSGHIGECAVVGKKYEGANCHALIIMSNGGECLSKYYVYYFHTLKGFKSLTPAITGGTIKHVLAGKVGKIKVPVPPLEVQQRIVDILDRFDTLCNDISNGLPAEIKLLKKQYEYFRDKLLTFKELKKEA